MNRVLLSLTLALVALLPVRVEAAIAFVQGATSAGNDATMTWSAAPLAANRVVVIAMMENEAQTISITGWTPAITTLAGPTDSGADILRAYTFCTVGDGSDTTMVLTSSGSGVVHAIAVEISGAEPCASLLREVQSNDVSSGTTHALTTDLTATAGDFIFSHVMGLTGGTNYTHNGSFTASIPASDVELNGASLGEYLTSSAGGAQDAPFTSSVAGTSFLMAVALKPTATGGGRPNALLLGVGGQ